MTIRGSKADQLRLGATLVLVGTEGGPADPLCHQWVLSEQVQHLPAAMTSTEALVTVGTAAGSRQVITRDEAAAAIKQLASAQGWDPSQCSTHAMRDGRRFFTGTCWAR